MSYNKAVFDLYRPIEDKAPEERSIHDKMSVIPLFVDPPVLYEDFLNALKAQDLAVADAQFGGKERIAFMRSQEEVVDDMVRKYRTFVTLKADGDKDIILSSGFLCTKPRESSGTPTKVQGVKKLATDISGAMKLNWNPIKNVGFYEVQTREVEAVKEDVWIELFSEVKIRFQYNGHIIGATFIEMDIYGKRFVFSGDIGRSKDELLRAPKKPQKADVLFIESTYGDRLHSEENLEERLAEIINNTYEKGGTLIIPSFAVERTQTLMYVIWKLKQKKAIPTMPMIMDSPMGANVLKVFEDNRDWHELKPEEYRGMCNAFRIVKSYKETWEIISKNEPKIVIAGSGMISGGRVLTYLQQYIGKLETTVLLAGFQAEGTRGRKLLEGASEVKIYGKEYPVEAEIINLEVLSAHADQKEMLDWMSEIENVPEKIFVVHGETAAAATFKEKVKERYGWEAEIPDLYSISEIPVTEPSV